VAEKYQITQVSDGFRARSSPFQLNMTGHSLYFNRLRLPPSCLHARSPHPEEPDPNLCRYLRPLDGKRGNPALAMLNP
jgi:hypothetical protein